jgi:hypothetical protein
VRKQPPLRSVVSCTSRWTAKIVRGYVAGGMTAWDLVLDCGHKATRYDRTGKAKKPTRAKCRACRDGSPTLTPAEPVETKR